MDYRGKTPKKLGMDWTENSHDILAISAKNIKNGRLINKDKAHYGDENLYKKWMKDGDIKVGDILMTSEAPLGESYLITKPLKAILSQRTFLIRLNKELADPWFFYSLIQSPMFKMKLLAKATGTTVIGIKQKELRKIIVDLPSLNIQKKIGYYFKVIDQKIRLNNQINDNLLDFLDTEFSHQFLGERNFPSGKVKDFVNIKRGASPRPIKDFLSENGRSWVKISDVTKLTTPFLYRTEQYIKESGIKKSRTIKPGTLILSNSATPGIPVISEILASVHDGWLIIDNYSLMDRNWFYLFFRQMRNSLVAQANGSVFNNLKTNIVKEFPVPIVDKSELTKFHKISNPIFEKLNQIQQENIELNRIKQTLLSQYF